MARGFVAGALSGGMLGLGLATVASIVAPPPQPPQVSTSAPETAQVPAVAPPKPDAQSATDTAPQAEPGGPAAIPDPDTLAAVTEEAQAPADVPQTGGTDGLTQPAAPAEGANVTLNEDEPVLPNPLALAPMEPQPADDLSISTEPAQPPAPAAEVAQSAFDPPAEETLTAQPPSDATATGPALVISLQEPSAPEAPEAQESVDLATPAPDSSTTQPATPSVSPATPAEDTPGVATETAEPPAQEPATPRVAQAEAEPQETKPAIPAQDEAQTAEQAPGAAENAEVAALAPALRPQIGTPAVPLTERETGIAIRRPGVAEQPVADQGDTGTDNAAEGDPRPIVRYAQPFENPDDKPLLSIVLIDDGTSPTSGAPGLAALRSFPNAISFAVDATLPDAVDRMGIYRANGFEVLAMIDLPEGAEATDAETSLDAVLSQMNEVVGVLEGTETGLQASRAASDQVTAILSSSGHGLLTQNQGLNTMSKLAQKEGVPAAPIFRDFDSKGQTATVIRRFLDQAAFKAGQEGAVIMLGRMRPDTISALLLWGLQDRAGLVAIAPVSAVLTRDSAP